MRRFALLAVMALAASPALAKQDKAPKDQNEMICRTTEEIGTRLGHKRTCMTRAQWAQMKQETRDVITRVQDNKPHQEPPG